LLHDDRFTVIEYVQGSNFYLALNWRRAEFGFDDLRVRRALSLGVDRAKLVATAVSGRGTPTLGPLSPGDEYYDPVVDNAFGYDPAEAARLLDSAGWIMAADGVRARGGQRLSFECVCQDDSVHRRVAHAVREQLAALGVQLELRFAKPFEAFYDDVSANPASFINKWLWQDSLDAAIGFSASHWQGAAIPALDSAYEAWLRAGTRAELQAAASTAQQIAAEQLPYIPLLTPNDVWVHSKRLRGWHPFQANLYPVYHGVRVEA
jgi:peptide/nickel transport system substrate-binding protein